MKKFIIAMVALMGTMFTSANAMSYEQAREQALFLTDKMAYELNLNEAQYEAAYEINLDYLMGVNTYDDIYADYWVRRNADFRIILLDWQYSAFIAASYFYRPIYWSAGCWHFGIYARYPHRDYFYFGRPVFYHTYRGGHAWHHNGGRSWYHGRSYASHNHGNFSGMRDGWNRGDYRGGCHETNGSRRDVGGTRSSSNTQQRHESTGTSRRGGAYNQSTRTNESVNGQNNRGGAYQSGARSGESSASGNFGGRRVGSNREAGSSVSGSRDNSSTRESVSGSRQSSTRSTVSRSIGTSRPESSVSRPSSSYSHGSSTTTRSAGSSYSGSHTRSSGASFGGSSSSSRGGGSFSGGSHGGGSRGGSSHGGGFGGRR